MIPKPTKQVFNYKSEAEAALLGEIPVDASGVSVYEPGYGNRKIVYLNVPPPQIEGA